MKLTYNELAALRTCCDLSTSIETMVSDPGCVMAGLPEMMEENNWTRHQAAAIIGSLEEKGLGYSDSNNGNGHIFWPTEEGYRLAFEGSTEC